MKTYLSLNSSNSFGSSMFSSGSQVLYLQVDINNLLEILGWTRGSFEKNTTPSPMGWAWSNYVGAMTLIPAAMSYKAQAQ